MILSAIVLLAAAPQVSLAYAQARDASGAAAHERELVTVSGVASVGSDGRSDALKFFIEDRNNAPYGIGLYTNRIRTTIAPGDVVTATGRVGMYASTVELLPDALQVVGRAAPPNPIEVHAEELIGPRWSGVLVRTRGKIEKVVREEDYADVSLGTSRGPLHVHIAGTSYNVDSLVDGALIEVTGIASQYKRRTATTPDFEVLPRTSADLKIVRSSATVLWTTLGVAAIAIVLIAAALTFSRPQKVRPEQIP